MAKDSELYEVLAYLTGYYPKDDIPTATKKLYVEVLRELPIEAVRQAAKDHTKHSPWFPKVSELYQPALAMAQQAAGGGRMTAEQALDQVAYMMTTHDATQINPLAWRAFEMVGGSWAWRHSDDWSYVRAEFCRRFESLQRSAELEAKTPQSLKDAARRNEVEAAKAEAERLMLGDGEGGDA